MLIEYKIENWMSFRDPVEFSMSSGQKHQINDRLPKFKGIDGNILPITAIFGGNASGKSNFVQSLYFVRNFVLQGNNRGDSIPVKPFKLDQSSKPTRFSFILAIDDQEFSYEFAVTTNSVINEALFENAKPRKKMIYKIKDGKIQLGTDFEHREMLKMIFRNKRPDQLLLTTVSQITDILLPVYSWFVDLTIVLPQTKYYTVNLRKIPELRHEMNEIFKRLDCGMHSIGIEKTKTGKNSSSCDQFSTQQKHECTIGIENADEQNELSRLVTYHNTIEGEKMRFEVDEESDGTKRLLEIIPMFLSLSKTGSKKVVVIDEINQSLHIQLVEALICAYLSNCSSKTRSQLIFTTHDVQPLEAEYLRPDEIWFMERNETGATALYSLDEFKDIDKEKNIRQSYLIGRFGGTPFLSLFGNHLNEPTIHKR